MKDIVMMATRRTRVGVLREGKHYSVPNDVANDLDSGAYRVVGEVVEAAVREPQEHAAKRTTRSRSRTKAPEPEQEGADDE